MLQVKFDYIIENMYWYKITITYISFYPNYVILNKHQVPKLQIMITKITKKHLPNNKLRTASRRQPLEDPLQLSSR